nr:o-acetyltransferase anaat [Quercus suber]
MELIVSAVSTMAAALARHHPWLDYLDRSASWSGEIIMLLVAVARGWEESSWSDARPRGPSSPRCPHCRVFATIHSWNIHDGDLKEVHKAHLPSQRLPLPPRVGLRPSLSPQSSSATKLYLALCSATDQPHPTTAPTISVTPLPCPFGMESRFYTLSATDQAVPRIYTRKVYTFAFPDDEHLRRKANSQVENALAVLSERWPFILDLVGPSGNEVWTTDSATANTMLLFNQRAGLRSEAVRTHRDIFWTRDLNGAFEHSYQQLCDRSMPPSSMFNELLYPPPHIPEPGDVCAVFGLNANYIKGGMLLCFNFHHCVFDGTSCVKLIREFARIMRRDEEIPGISMLEADIIDARKTFEEAYSSSASPRSVDSFPEYSVNNLQTAKRGEAFDVTKRVITFSSTVIEQLKATVNKAYGQEKGILSKQACLAALVWVVVMRARAVDLDPSGTAKLGIAVDFRPRMKNMIPPTFVGNAIVHTVAHAQVGKLAVQHLFSRDIVLGRPKDAECTIKAILTGALEIRDAVDTITQDTVRDRLQLFATIHDPAELHNNYAKALDLPGYGLDFSSWKDQCADLDFGIEGASSKSPDYVRMTWLASEGALNILPRRSGSDGDANWEVLLGLREKDWVGVQDDLLLGGWATRIVV